MTTVIPCAARSFDGAPQTRDRVEHLCQSREVPDQPGTMRHVSAHPG